MIQFFQENLNIVNKFKIYFIWKDMIETIFWSLYTQLFKNNMEFQYILIQLNMFVIVSCLGESKIWPFEYCSTGNPLHLSLPIVFPFLFSICSRFGLAISGISLKMYFTLTVGGSRGLQLLSVRTTKYRLQWPGMFAEQKSHPYWKPHICSLRET